MEVGNNVKILYVTFRRDLEFLRYSLQSFRKYCTGFKGVTIVVPVDDVPLFIPLESEFGTKECPVLIKNFLEFSGKGFVHHLAMACYADVFHPDATHTLHMDPDCLWSKPTTPDDYFVDDKPVLVIEPYDALKVIHPGRYNWKGVTEAALKFPCTHETMCRHPAVHHKRTYPALRSYMEHIHLTPFLDFVLKQKNSFPQGFAEYPTLGAFVMKFMPKEYHFIDRGWDGDKNDPDPHLVQEWSYTLLDGRRDDTLARIRKILSQ